MSDTFIAPSFAAQPAAQRLPWQWLNRSVVRYSGTMEQLSPLIPKFTRRRRRYGDHEIVTGDEYQRVVSKVSPTYELIQHAELLHMLPQVLQDEGYDFASLYGELSLTPYGERMELVLHLPSLSDTPPDGHTLDCRLRCLNSVDRTTALEAGLQWYRQICSNGMFGWGGERLRRIHRFGDTLEWVRERLAQRFEQLPQDRRYFAQLSELFITPRALEDWVDVFVARHWDKPAAARVLHVCRTGHDGVIGWADEDVAAHELEITPTMEVPGACAPVNDLYHVGQALSWVAGQSEALHTRFSRTSSIPKLLRYLTN